VTMPMGVLLIALVGVIATMFAFSGSGSALGAQRHDVVTQCASASATPSGR